MYQIEELFRQRACGKHFDESKHNTFSFSKKNIKINKIMVVVIFEIGCKIFANRVNMEMTLIHHNNIFIYYNINITFVNRKIQL